jgi:predicted nucleotidyltransferase
MVARRYPVRAAWLFGSFARRENTPDSDVDLVIDLMAPLGFERACLCEELERSLNCSVDVIFGEHQLYQPVRAEFDHDKVLLYEAH